MYYEGQKVVCINDTFSALTKMLYAVLPVKDKVYVIRDLELGIGVAPERVPKVSLKLVGLVNPLQAPPACKEPGYDADRFAPLSPEEHDSESSGTRYASQRNKLPDLVGVPLEKLAACNPNGGPLEDWENIYEEIFTKAN